MTRIAAVDFVERRHARLKPDISLRYFVWAGVGVMLLLITRFRP